MMYITLIPLFFCPLTNQLLLVLTQLFRVNVDFFTYLKTTELILRSLCHLIKQTRALDVNLICIRSNIQILSHILRITTSNQVTHLNYYFQKQTRVSLITLNC